MRKDPCRHFSGQLSLSTWASLWDKCTHGSAGTHAGQVGTCGHAPTTPPAQTLVLRCAPPNKVGCQHPQHLCPRRVPRCRCCNAQQLACLRRSICLRTARLSHKCECPHLQPRGGGTSWLAQGRRGRLMPVHLGVGAREGPTAGWQGLAPTLDSLTGNADRETVTPVLMVTLVSPRP